ncbi:hypothetical protein CR513_56011, partial [Mucuna pruriens]
MRGGASPPACNNEGNGGKTGRGGNADAFWAQPFNKEIDGTPIPPNFHEVVVEPLDGTQDPHTHL